MTNTADGLLHLTCPCAVHVHGHMYKLRNGSFYVQNFPLVVRIIRTVQYVSQTVNHPVAVRGHVWAANDDDGRAVSRASCAAARGYASNEPPWCPDTGAEASQEQQQHRQ